MKAGLLGDLRFAFRYLLQRPGFAGTIVISLALAIGANTAVFSIVDAVLFGALPVANPDRLVAIYTLDERNPGHLPVSDQNAWDIREQASDLLEVAHSAFAPVELDVDGHTKNLPALIVTANYFDVLGVQMLAGGGFAHDDHALGGHPEVVVTHRLWVEAFGGDAGILGRPVVINGSRFTVVGIAPERFTSTTANENALFLPYSSHREIGADFPWFGDRRWLAFLPVARLVGESTIEQARAELERIGGRLAATHPDMNRHRTFAVVPLSKAMLGPDQRDGIVQAGTMMMTFVGFILLIACANAANLLLARAANRRSEMALRRVLGARTSRLIRQLLTESLLLATIAALAGLIIAVPLRDFIWSLRPDGFGLGGIRPELDVRVLAFTAVVTISTGLLFGFAPALRMTRADLLTPLQEETMPAAAVGARFGMRSLLVVVQVALSMVAIAGAGMFVRSMDNARNVELGFQTERVLLGLVDHRGDGEVTSRFEHVTELLATLPEVEAVALSSRAPIGGGGIRRTTYVDGRESDADDGILIDFHAVTPGYFEVIRQPILEGRGIERTDARGKRRVAAVNATFAQRYWPDGGALGKQIRFNGEPEPLTIVGVVATSKAGSPMDAPTPGVYVPLAQWPQPVAMLVARSQSDPISAAPIVAETILGAGRDLRVIGLRPLAQVVDETLVMPRAGALLLGLCGILALGLASVGLYGVMAYTVRQRTREIGIRMALGARARDVLRLVLLQAMSLVVLGIGLGTLGALLLQHRYAELLFEVPLGDAWTFGGALLILASTAAIAGWLPARHATRIDPSRAIRHD